VSEAAAAGVIGRIVESELAAALAAVVGCDHVLLEPDLRASYEHDLTGRFAGSAALVVRPGTADEVSGVVRACAAAGAPIAVQGGNTGMVGGAIPRNGEIVLSLVRLDDLEAVDDLAAQVECGAGVTLERLQAHARAAGFDFPVDFASRGTATVGGVVATNAGGALAARYGMTRAWVAGLEAVLADGAVLRRLGGLLKDNAGYDLTGLLVGSEGTLAIVTRARLRLTPYLPARAVALLALRSLDDALALLRVLREHAPSLVAADYFHASGLDLVCARRGFARPFKGDHDTYVVAECAARHDPTDELAEAAAEADDLVVDAAGASDVEGRAALWSYREAHNEAVAARGVPHKLDVTVPLAAVPAFERDVLDGVGGRWPTAETYLYGHLGDGNVHVNIVGPPPEEDAVDDLVLQLVARHGGSISAEHGVGVAKARWLHLTRGPEEIAAMRAIKRALDPNGLLSPGRLLA
jgi:FAD/FMN-containing dehydrogenase